MTFATRARRLSTFAVSLGITLLSTASAEEAHGVYSFGNTNVQYGYSWSGDNDFIIGYGSDGRDRHQFRFEHQSTWRYGYNYFFADVLHAPSNLGGERDFGFPCCGDGKDTEAYALVNANLSLSRLSNKDISWGPITDVAVEGRFEYGSFFNYHAAAPGLSVYLDIPGITEKPGDLVQLIYWRRFNDDDFVSGDFDSGGAATNRYADHNLWGLNVRKEWSMGGRRWQHQTFLRYQQEADGGPEELKRFNRVFWESELYMYLTNELSVGFRSELFYDAGGISFAGDKSDWRPIVVVKLDWDRQ
jgi:hypothetical protein